MIDSLGNSLHKLLVEHSKQFLYLELEKYTHALFATTECLYWYKCVALS